MIKLFFVTDIHGSNVCYRKFLNALPIYGVDTAVLIAVTWAAGIIWYLVWKQRSKSVGVDVSMTYGELPPE